MKRVKSKSHKSISNLHTNEADLLKFFSSLPTDPRITMGIGDDCAVFDGDDTMWAITTDSLVENTHFQSSWITPYILGRKSAVSNLSDIAAQSAWPRYSLISLTLPQKYFSKIFIKKLYDGLYFEYSKFGTTIIGGNVTSGEKLIISNTILGSVKRPSYRDQATPGQVIFMTGSLGQSALELQKLFLKKIKKMSHIPIPRVQLSYDLGVNKLIGACIDISDGLTLDLERMADQSKVKFVIEKNKIPIDNSVQKYIKKFHNNYDQIISAGGEVYELLFTANINDIEEITKIAKLNKVKITNIGKVQKGIGVYIKDENNVITRVSNVGYIHGRN